MSKNMSKKEWLHLVTYGAVFVVSGVVLACTFL
jgi:hypothetical protein